MILGIGIDLVELDRLKELSVHLVLFAFMTNDDEAAG